MAWPLATDFNVMLQNPKLAFKDSGLQTCTIERDENEQPRARAGAFATVYRAMNVGGGGDVAIRVFTTSSDGERRERYAAISNYLRSRNVSSLVGFDYTEKGIRHPSGKWYPLVTMDWVKGDTLFDWLRIQCTGQNKKLLGSASEQWIELVDELITNQIAHGDLQHGNVMVTDQNHLKLVDYDCMYVPELKGRRNLEIGVEPYQHPSRDERTELFEGLDNFSALFILVALRAFTATPKLWSTFIEQPNGEMYDKLLFRKEDFDDPDQSQLVQELRRSPDEKVRKWANDLLDLIHVPLLDVPTLDTFVNDVEKIRSVLAQKDFDGALKLAGQKKSIPDDLLPQLADAKRRVQCRTNLETAVKNGDEEAMQRLYDPKLLDDYPKARSSVDIAKSAGKVVAVLDKLKAAKQAQSWRQFVQTWENNSTLLDGRRSAQPFRDEAQLWSRRNQHSDLVLKLLDQDPCDVQRLSQAWTDLKDAGGHPDTNARKGDVEAKVRLFTALQTLANIPNSPSEQDDIQFLQHWDEKLFAGQKSADKFRTRLGDAQKHQKILQQIKQLAQKFEPPNISQQGEKSLMQAGQLLPAGYGHSLSGRVEQARERLVSLQKLSRAWNQKPQSESELAEAWSAVERAQAEPLVNAPLRDRLLTASRRAPALAKLKSVNLSAPKNQLDAEILKAWDEDALGDCADALPWKQAYLDAHARKPLLQRLQQALDSNDDGEIANCLSSGLLDDYPFPVAISSRVARARGRILGARELVQALQKQDRAKFRELFDVTTLREYAPQFNGQQQTLSDWIESEILPLDRIGLKSPLVGRPVSSVPGSKFTRKVQWNWPPPRFSDECILKICRNKPDSKLPPDAVEGFTIPVSRDSFDGVGYRSIPFKPEFKNSYVVVWATVDLGFQKFFSQSLVLGRIN